MQRRQSDTWGMLIRKGEACGARVAVSGPHGTLLGMEFHCWNRGRAVSVWVGQAKAAVLMRQSQTVKGLPKRAPDIAMRTP